MSKSNRRQSTLPDHTLVVYLLIMFLEKEERIKLDEERSFQRFIVVDKCGQSGFQFSKGE